MHSYSVAKKSKINFAFYLSATGAKSTNLAKLSLYFSDNIKRHIYQVITLSLTIALTITTATGYIQKQSGQM